MDLAHNYRQNGMHRQLACPHPARPAHPVGTLPVLVILSRMAVPLPGGSVTCTLEGSRENWMRADSATTRSSSVDVAPLAPARSDSDSCAPGGQGSGGQGQGQGVRVRGSDGVGQVAWIAHVCCCLGAWPQGQLQHQHANSAPCHHTSEGAELPQHARMRIAACAPAHDPNAAHPHAAPQTRLPPCWRRGTGQRPA